MKSLVQSRGLRVIYRPEIFLAESHVKHRSTSSEKFYIQSMSEFLFFIE